MENKFPKPNWFRRLRKKFRNVFSRAASDEWLNSMEAVVSESPKTNETSATRRTVVEGASAGLLAASMTGVAGCATAAADQEGAAGSLYQRLGGVFPIAAVVDHFSDALIRNPIVGQGSQNPQLREWHTRSLDRLPGLKFMRTLWVCSVSGGPFQYTPVRPGRTNLGLEEAHRALRISPAEFDEVAAELGRTLDHFRIPEREKTEVLAAFAAHKDEVTEGYRAAQR
jgi:hemoglobin